MKKIALLLMSTLSISLAYASDQNVVEFVEVPSTGPITRWAPENHESILPNEIRVSVNTQLDLTKYPGTITIVDITAGIDAGIDVGTVDKAMCALPRIGVNNHYALTKAHADRIKFGIRYDGDGYPSQVIPCRNFDKETSTVSDSVLPLNYILYTLKEGEKLKDLKVGDQFEALTPLAGVRINIVENGVIGGDAPFRGHFYVRYGINTKPLQQYYGLKLAHPLTFLNDDLVYQEVMKFTGFTTPVGAPTVSEYSHSAADRYDFHKGQLNIINQYLKLAGEKYGITLDRKDSNQCHALLNFFISKGIVQSNERVKYAQELDLNLDKDDYQGALSPENEVPSDNVSGVLSPENELPLDSH